jgi:hypothetical protein
MPNPTPLALLNHFTIAIFAFLHDLPPHRPARRLEALAPWWAPWWSRLTRPGTAAALDASGFFLPYVQGQLYPETVGLHNQAPGPHYDRWVSRLWRWSSRELASFCDRLPDDCVLRWTCRQEMLDRIARFSVVSPHAAADRANLVQARLDWVDALLFPSGVGFLLFKVRLEDARPDLAQLITLNEALQLTHPVTLSRPLHELRFADGTLARFSDVLNVLVRGLAAGTDAPCADDGWPLPTVERTPSYLDTAPGRAHGDRCALLTYACVDAAEGEWEGRSAGVFACAEDRLLFEYAAGLGVNRTIDDPAWEPARDHARRLCADQRLHPWRCWRMMALKEAVAFLATERVDYNRGPLPRNIEQMYLPLYLYALHQRHVLLHLADQLLHGVGQASGPVRQARALLGQFIAFRTRYWFNEVTQRPQGGDLYRLMQRALEVPALYELVTGSVKEAREFYQERWDRRVRAGLTLVTLLFGPLLTVFSGACLMLGRRPEALVEDLLPIGATWFAATFVGLVAGFGSAAWLLRRGWRNRRVGHAARRSTRRRRLSEPRDPPPVRMAG